MFGLLKTTMSCTDGLYFGIASATTSSVVLIASLRPVDRFRMALVASLVAIAIVDALSDAYALWNSTGSTCTASTSLAVKVAIAGGLAMMIANRVRQRVVYVVLGAVVAVLVALSAMRHTVGEGIFMFVGAAVASFVLRMIMAKFFKKQATS